MRCKFAILVDSGFIKKKLQQQHKHFPTVDEIEAEITRIKAHPLLATCTLLRVYFYDAPPAAGVLTNPLDGARIDLSAHPNYSQNVSLQQRLEIQPDFALREGDTAVHGWSVGSKALRALTKTPRA